MNTSTTLTLGELRLSEMRKVQKKAPDFINTDGRHLLRKRLHAKDQMEQEKPSVRLYWIEKLFQNLNGFSFTQTYQLDEAMKIGAVGEYCITIMYLDNHYQDEKYGVKDEMTRALNRTERDATKADLDRYIQTQFSGYIQERIIQTVEKLFFLYHEGMKLDKSALTYENLVKNNPNQLHRISQQIDSYVNVDAFLTIFNGYKPQKYASLPYENYFRLILTRAFLINAVFFQVFTELMIDLYGKKENNYNYLIEFSRVFGMAQQLVNDNCDYLPISYGYSTVCKLPEDTFSDLRRGLVTLPVMAFFSQAAAHKGELYEHYSLSSVISDGTTDNDQRWLLNLLKSSGALGYSMGAVCSLAKHGEQLVDDPMFKDLFSFVRANRYYQAYGAFSYA